MRAASFLVFPSETGGLLAGVYLVAMMLSLGLGLRVGREPEERLRGHVGLLVRGLLAELVLVPGIAVFLTRSLHLATDVGLALLVLAASPGGRFAPHLRRLGGGTTPLGAENTVLLAKITLISAPLTMRLLLGLHDLHVKELPIIVQVFVLQLVPLYAGKALGRRRRDLADRIDRPLWIVSHLAALAVLVALLARHGLSAFELLGDRGWLAVLILALVSVGLGWLLGGPAANTRRGLVIGLLSRNLALALLLAGLVFPGQKAQLAVFAIWCVFLGVAALFILLARTGAIGTAHRRQRPA